MKLRLVLAAALIAVLAAPLLAVAGLFTDVPADHEHAASIRWASNPENFPNRQALFVGYGDESFKPDKDLTENQLRTVVKRLFDTQDSWTRAETAALLHHGYNALYGTTTTTPVATTRPVVIEEEPTPATTAPTTSIAEGSLKWSPQNWPTIEIVVMDAQGAAAEAPPGKAIQVRVHERFDPALRGKANVWFILENPGGPAFGHDGNSATMFPLTAYEGNFWYDTFIYEPYLCNQAVSVSYYHSAFESSLSIGGAHTALPTRIPCLDTTASTTTEPPTTTTTIIQQKSLARHLLLTDRFDEGNLDHVVPFGETITLTLQTVTDRQQPVASHTQHVLVEVRNGLGSLIERSWHSTDRLGKIEWSWVRNDPDTSGGESARITVKFYTAEHGLSIWVKDDGKHWDIYTKTYRWESTS